MNKLTKQVLVTNIQAQIQGKDVLPICISGSRGTGKTSTIKEAANSLNAGLLNVSVPTKDITYMTGLPEFVSKGMDKYSVTGSSDTKGTNWSAPELIVQANHLAEKYGSSIILLDDFHKLSGGMQETMYEFLLERKLGDYKLHPNTAIVCAMNFSKESGAGQMEEPIKDRLSLLHVKFDFDFWYNNFGKFTHHYISSFLKANPNFTLEAESITLSANASPRSWTQLSNDFELYPDQFVQENTIFLAEQKVSKHAAKELAAHIAYMETIDFSNVVNTRKMVKVQELPVLERLMWAYIINYIDTPEDAAYIITLINLNQDEPNFIGYIMGELYTKYLAHKAGKPITIANQILLEKIIGPYDESDYKLTKKQAELLDNTSLESNLFELAQDYLI